MVNNTSLILIIQSSLIAIGLQTRVKTYLKLLQELDACGFFGISSLCQYFNITKKALRSSSS